MARPDFHAVSPCLRYCTGQPAEPGEEGGVQYRPIEWNVGTAFSAPPPPPLPLPMLMLMMSSRELPSASKARALSWCVPLANLVVSSTHCMPPPMLPSVLSRLPSRKNLTLFTPTPCA